MNRFLKNAIVFLLLLSVFYIAGVYVWENYMPTILKPNVHYVRGAYGNLNRRISDIDNYENIDILFLGSSHTYRGFDTRVFSKNGYKSFNLGSSAQTPIQTEVLLKRYLEELNPKLIVYEVFPANFYLDGVESSLDLIANDENDLHSLEMAIELKNIKTFNTLLYGSTVDIFNLEETKLITQNDTYVSGGYVEKKIHYFNPSDVKYDDKTITIDDAQLERFEGIIETIKNKDIELILVYAPIPKVFYDSYKNNDYYDSLMSSYSTYYNFNEILSLNDSLHFYDYNHLNQKGVEVFNKKLIEVLNDRKSIMNDKP